MNEVCCFGELLIRLSPQQNCDWIRDQYMQTYLGGAELNVANALSCWGKAVRYITRLPQNYVAQEIVKYLQQHHINTEAIQWGGSRIGSYFLPQGTDIKNTRVIYDRVHSSFWEWDPGTTDWDILLEGCTWFHWSAISPALNPSAAKVCEEAILAARRKGLTISVDLNYRSKLWQYGVNPPEVMVPLLQHCDVVMGNLWAAESLLNISSPVKESKGLSKELLVEAAEIGVVSLQNAFPRLQQIAYTFRLEQDYFAVLQDGKSNVVSQTFSLTNILDKVGSGDCFMGALIYGLTEKMHTEMIVNFAASAAVGKMQEQGDATRQTVAMIHQRISK